ncbi:unnamed protein product [Diamesa serratosioi]
MDVNDRDSYEFYVLFHQNKKEFTKYLAGKNEHCLEALRNLILNLKVEKDAEKCYLKMIINLLEDTDVITDKFKIKLVECLELLVHKYPDDPCLKGSKNLTILRVIAKQTDGSLFSSEVTESLVQILFQESPSTHIEVLHILNTLISKQNEDSKTILESILAKSTSRLANSSNKNLCYFFETMCKTGTIVTDANGLFLQNLLTNFFDEDDHIKRKQGLFLIKTAIHMNCLSANEEKNWMKFILIAEALEQYQSHLILPTLSNLHDIKFSGDHATFMFILCKLIITHDNTVIKTFGLKYILNKMTFVSNNIVEDDKKMVTILCELNSTGLYGDVYDREADISEGMLNSFIQRNFQIVFRNIIRVKWTSAPIFHIMTAIYKCFENLAPSVFNENFINIMENQISYVGKNIQNLTIRAGVQAIYSEILLIMIQNVDLNDLSILIRNIFYMEKSPKAWKNIKSCITSLNNEMLIFSIDLTSYGLSEFLFQELLINGECSYERFIEVTSTLTNHDKLIIRVLNNVINDNVDLIPHYFQRFQKHLNELESELDKKDLCSDKVLYLLNVLNIGYFCFADQTKDQFETIFKKVQLHETHTDYHRMHMNILVILSNLLPLYEENEVILDAIYSFLNVNLEALPKQINYPFYKCYIEICDKYITPSLVVKQLDATQYLNNTNFLIECLRHEDLRVVIGTLFNYMETYTIPEESYVDLYHVINHIFNEILEIRDTDVFNGSFRKFVMVMFVNAGLKIDYWLRDVLLKYFNIIMEKFSGQIKTDMLSTIYEILISTHDEDKVLDPIIIDILKQGLLYGEILTKDQKIESSISRGIYKTDPEMKKKSTLDGSKVVRLNNACFLKEYSLDYEAVIETYIENFSELSRSKPKGYFLNSFIHHLKLRFLQPLFFCTHLSTKCKDILIFEIVNINNQTNISAIVEIVLAKFNVDVFGLLTNKKLDLKSTTLKSIFAILTMQIRSETQLDVMEVKLQKMIKLVMPYTMGQHFGTRIFAQAAITQCCELFKSLCELNEPGRVFRAGNDACEMIQGSLKAKNALKYFQVAQSDFRLSLNLKKQLWTFDAIYIHILRITNMSDDGIITKDLYYGSKDWFQAFLCEDKSLELLQLLENCTDPENVVINEELETREQNEQNEVSSMNSQQKYVPYKFQIPGDKLLSTLPSIFENGIMKARSELTVVASLVSRPPNVGGLARTCEVFGAENFIIDSLKIIENTEFKALSKTAEKWLKITEIKNWQLFDLLLKMKMEGYAIVGAEQTANSKNLIGTPIPKKAVLLLGHEKEGIPANLLALLDLTIEIPQNGVVRSLNVHVSGSIVMWEYAKQHLFNNQKTSN